MRWLVLFSLAACATSEGAGAPGMSAADSEARRAAGKELFFGRAGCAACHRVGPDGDKVRGPDLAGRFAKLADITAAVVDPDGKVTEGYAPGVMTPPDRAPISLGDDEIVSVAIYVLGAEPTTAELGEARSAIPAARKAREGRREDRRVDGLIARAGLGGGDPALGRVAFEKAGCALCHGDATRAPPLDGVGARLNQADIARWILAPPSKKMPAYEETIALGDLKHLVAWVAR